MGTAVQAQYESSRASSDLASMDAAAEYVRKNLSTILPMYVVAMLPFSAAIMLTIDIVTSQYRAMTLLTSWCLVAATLWRWAWLAALQRRVQAVIRGGEPHKIRGRLLSILFLRLVASACMTWGSLVIAPGIYGFLIGGMATPLHLEPSDRPKDQIKTVISWITSSQKRLLKILTSLSFLYVLGLICFYALIRIVLGTLLPTFLGIDPSDMGFTLESWTGILVVSYLVGLVFDLYWAVLSVMIFYDLQSRRLAPDLRVRIRNLRNSTST
ncbi:MAG: hypothetical protein DHS20C16_04860 [Phycisphaerae bacterium]|nr:MAG: hypothetical protein DHS20C16_04860 [Phycisphaerae bacterium]